MALTDAYATAAEYRARTGITSTSDDADLLEHLKAAARQLEGHLMLPLGAFNASSANVTRYFDGTDSARLTLRTPDNLQHAITTIDAEGVQVDTTGDGSFDTTFDPTNDAWAVAEPYNAAEVGEPFTAIRLLPIINATASVGDVLSRFPSGHHNIKVIGTWGWSTVPDLIRELNIKLARDVRDSLEAGSSGDLQMIDSGITVRSDTWRFWKRAEERYTRRIPSIA